MVDQRVGFELELREVVQRFSNSLHDEEVAVVLMSHAFVAYLRKNDIQEACNRMAFCVDALSECTFARDSNDGNLN